MPDDDKLNDLREKCREFQVRLLSHPDFVVLQKLWADLGIGPLIVFDGTYTGQRKIAGAKEGVGY